jgi:hypothetical protein
VCAIDIMSREFIARSTEMLRFPARLRTSASSHHDLSLAAFITNIPESDFRYTHARVNSGSSSIFVHFWREPFTGSSRSSPHEWAIRNSKVEEEEQRQAESQGRGSVGSMSNEQPIKPFLLCFA